jgi:hypothetical protein
MLRLMLAPGSSVVLAVADGNFAKHTPAAAIIDPGLVASRISPFVKSDTTVAPARRAWMAVLMFGRARITACNTECGGALPGLTVPAV